MCIRRFGKKQILGLDKYRRMRYNDKVVMTSGRGGTGRRVRLRGVWETVWVQVPSTAPNKNESYDTIGIATFVLFLCPKSFVAQGFLPFKYKRLVSLYQN